MAECVITFPPYAAEGGTLVVEGTQSKLQKIRHRTRNII